MSNGWGAGGVLSSTRDVATFFHAVFDNLLAPASIDAMQTTTPGSGGYGLSIDTEQVTDEAEGWGTAGATIGYTSAAGITDEGWRVAVLTNHVDVASGGREPSPMDLVAAPNQRRGLTRLDRDHKGMDSKLDHRQAASHPLDM